MGLSKFIQKIKDSIKTEPFNSNVFDHPVAQKTEWIPKASGGANFKTRSLKKVSSSKLVYKGSIFLKIFGGVITAIPVFIFFSFISTGGANFGEIESLFMLVPLIFVIVGVCVVYFGSRPIVIDKKLGYLYKSYKKPTTGLNVIPKKKWIALDQVVALQLLKERVRSKNSSYSSYEINFVFKDATRYNIVDHGSLSNIEKDAVVISNLLGVPIWNKMTNETILPKGSDYTDDRSHYDSKGQYQESQSQYDSGTRYDDPSENDRYSSSSQNNEDLDEPYDSLKRRKM